jgi:hypothetical protein
VSEENEMSQSASKAAVPEETAPEQAAASQPPAPRTPAKQAPAKKTTAGRTAARKTPVEPVTKAPVKKAPAKKAAPAKTPMKNTAKVTAKKAPVKKAPVKKAASATTTTKNTARTAAPTTPTTPATKAPAATAPPAKATAEKAPAEPGPANAAAPTSPPAAPEVGTLAPPPRVPTPRARTVDHDAPDSAAGGDEPVRRSWFSRRPLTSSPIEWTSGWSEKSRPVTRFRTALVVGPLLVALAAAGAYGARLMYADPDDVAASGPEVTCWDGTSAAAGACPLPTGAEGLAWVYPSFDPQDEGCTDVLVAHPEYRRPTMWACDTDIHGRPLRITYSELTSVASGLAYHEKLFADGKKSAFPGPHGTVDNYVWRQPEPVDGRYRKASMYVDYPYAVLIEATTLRDRDRTYRDLVRQRDPRHVTTGFD